MKNSYNSTVFPEKESKKDQAYSLVKEMIITGKLQENTFISERMLGDLIGVSRTPIKAALNELSKEHLVTEYPGKGFMVVPITTEDVQEIYQLRMVLDRMAFKMVLEANLNGVREEIIYHLREMRQAIRQQDYKTAELHDQAFHDCYFDAVPNRRLGEMLYMLRDQIRRLLITTQDDQERMDRSGEEHEKILTCIEKDDIDGACDALIQHLESACKYHVKSLQQRKRPF